MNKRRSSHSILPVLLLLVALCGGAAFLAVGYLYVSNQVVQTFGEPSAALSPTQQLSYKAKLYLGMEQLTQPVDPSGSPRPFRIELGESVNSIAYNLEVAGLIPDADTFRSLVVYSGLDTQIQAGDYSLSPAMTPVAIAHQLLDSTPGEVSFQILKGWRLDEIAAALPTSGLRITPEEFLQATQYPNSAKWLPQGLTVQASLEGFLFPDSYRFKREISLDELLTTVQENFNLKVTAEMREAFSRQGLDLFQAVTLASIIQREAVVEEEQPMIASVFFNRINAGMKLDSDPTVQYALGYNSAQATWWTNPLSLTDLEFDSAYNTYRYPGLPPGPISNPGLSALKAVAFPADTPYFYFRARCDGSGRHEFAETFEEHVQNACP